MEDRECKVALACLLLLAAALLIFPRLNLPLLEPEEALYAEIPRQMLWDGQFVVPTLHGRPYLDKPPLLYWLAMESYDRFGVHIWSARLVSSLAAWLTVGVVFAWGRSVGGNAAGLASAAVLLSTGDFVYRAPMLTPNGLLALWTTVGLAAGQHAVRTGKLNPAWWAVSAIATGAGVLTKGPVAVVLVAGPLFVLARPRLLAAVAHVGLAFAVAAPWFAAVCWQQPEFAEYFFWKHHVERYTAPFDHAKPFYFYLPQVLLGGLPWTGWLAWQLAGKGRANGWLSFALLAAAWGLLFFSVSGSKRPVYLVPLWPAFAVAVGATLPRRGVLLLFAGVSYAVLLALVVFGLPVYHRTFSLADSMAFLSRQPPDVPVYCYPQAWNALNFGRGGEEYESFDEAKLPDLVTRLHSHEMALVVVKAGGALDRLRQALDEFDVEESGKSGTVRVIVVRRGRRGPPESR